MSLAIVPATQTLAAAGQPAQFIAIGTTSSGATCQPDEREGNRSARPPSTPQTWGSSSMSVATINSRSPALPRLELLERYCDHGRCLQPRRHRCDVGPATLTVNIAASPGAAGFAGDRSCHADSIAGDQSDRPVHCHRHHFIGHHSQPDQPDRPRLAQPPSTPRLQRGHRAIPP